MKISIISAYTWYNKGDAGILLGTVREIEEYLKMKNITNYEFNVLSFTPELDGKMYNSSDRKIKSVHSNIFNPFPFKKTKWNKMIKIINLVFKFFFFELISLIKPSILIRKNISIRSVYESEFVIVCGGGFLGGKKFNSLIHLAQFHIFNNLGKTLVIWGTSIEPPNNKLINYFTKKVLVKMDAILPRESITEAYLSTFYPKERTILTPDLAFKLPNLSVTNFENPIQQIRNKYQKKRLIGITLRNWTFPNNPNPKEAQKHYENSIINLINNMCDCIFVFIPQVILLGDDDRKVAYLIRSKLKNSNQFIILKDDYSPLELKNIISKVDQFVGTRMHSNIFSSTVLNPPIAIAYESKTIGIMNNLELNQYVVNIEDVTGEDLIKLLRTNLENRAELKMLVEKKTLRFQKLIRRATIKLDKITHFTFNS